MDKCRKCKKISNNMKRCICGYKFCNDCFKNKDEKEDIKEKNDDIMRKVREYLES